MEDYRATVCVRPYIQCQSGLQAINSPLLGRISRRPLAQISQTAHHPLPSSPPPARWGSSTRPAPQSRRRRRRSASGPGTPLRTEAHPARRSAAGRKTKINHDISASLHEVWERIPRSAAARDERERETVVRSPEAGLEQAERGGWERAHARGARGGGTRAPSSWPPPASLHRSGGGFDPAAGRGERVAPHRHAVGSWLRRRRGFRAGFSGWGGFANANLLLVQEERFCFTNRKEFC